MSIGFILISCIDSKYDLSQIESDGIAIGNNDSEFLMPLVNIKFQASNFNASTEDDMSISGLQEQINVWLPAQLPNNASYVDIQKLRECLDGNGFDYLQIYSINDGNIITNPQNVVAMASSQFTLQEDCEER